jgi:hypothetical protein
MTDWIVLRFPRSSNATEMSGVMSASGAIFVERGPTIPVVCDALLAHAPATKPLLVDPLDGRHGLAHLVLEESQKRGWEFGRHPPAGSELYILDLDGPERAASLSTTEATALLESLVSAMGEAWNDSELGESMGIGRQALTLCLHHFGAWHAYTYWVMSNLFQASAGTGNRDNIREASAFLDYLLSRDQPATFTGGQSSIVRLDEIAHRCLATGDVALARRVYDAALAIARRAFGEDSSIYQQVQQRRAASLPPEAP